MEFIPSNDPSYEDLAYSIMEEMGDLDSSDWKSQYFDYEAFGRDLVLGGDYTMVSNGYIRN